jgi:hypothetical protein
MFSEVASLKYIDSVILKTLYSVCIFDILPSTSFTDDAVGTRIKRKRKPSEKVLELQAEKVKKPSKSSKSSKTKNKSLFDESNGNGFYYDELSDE